ncbi:hypothetical protein SARC_00660 [Sphaeroforma arctica JP610]|uniref:Prephenate/arogenate dehydrogenase domain-containing protein n=1 Tax=Sphaeroforma arctica JP610 TaxID=667725 RepID=A0A0L0GDY6_9EUKA|nr:hypothetical protein SARC_00660 [Sphaeroforma arctica JP610]KNC87225.1 hypothetical protein SARC_00660 [Sphaeroforma arctica JP610]|eukprot:XP_014161127.1 hypothetical protein SARC_00660 [Sphaeroforma arctica JP610]
MTGTAPLKVGIIGLGDMGILYAKLFAGTGLTVVACDREERYAELKADLTEVENLEVVKDGFGVARLADLLIFSVETRVVDAVVKQYGPAVKYGCIVAGQTSVKGPEIDAFDKYLPSDVNVVTCHSLHGPGVSPVGQTMVVMRHRASDEAFDTAVSTYKMLGSKLVFMSCEEHDKVTADTQVATHLGFLAMGTAWMHMGLFPWEHAAFLGGVDNVKILMALRIYSMKSHVYSGLALLNKHAKRQALQYSKSVTALLQYMITENEEAFAKRIHEAGDAVFHNLSASTHEIRRESDLLLSDEVLGEYGLGVIPADQRTPNSHLSIIAMVDCWHQLGVNPYNNLACQTPVFRLRLGIAQYLFKDRALLDESIRCAVYAKEIRADDMEFHAAVREWVTIICKGDESAYEQQFNETRSFFEDKLVEGREASSRLISKLITAPQPKR